MTLPMKCALSARIGDYGDYGGCGGQLDVTVGDCRDMVQSSLAAAGSSSCWQYRRLCGLEHLSEP
jgi:hypothetical protein